MPSFKITLSVFFFAAVAQFIIIQYDFPELVTDLYREYVAPLKPGYLFLYVPYIVNCFRYAAPLPNREVRWKTPEKPSPDNKKRPNVVLILADDLGFNDISFFGGGFDKGRISTPNIDSIGKDGVSFKNAYSGDVMHCKFIYNNC